MYQLRLIGTNFGKKSFKRTFNSSVPETVIKIAIYNEVHDAVQNKQEMIDGC